VEFNLADLFESAVDHLGSQTAMVSGARRLSYTELDQRANRLAHYLERAGIGPGAHSRITSGGAKRALSAIKSPEGWRAEVEARGHGLDSDETLSAEEAADEYLLMGLRLSEGLDLARLAAIDGDVRLDYRALDARVNQLADRLATLIGSPPCPRPPKPPAPLPPVPGPGPDPWPPYPTPPQPAPSPR